MLPFLAMVFCFTIWETSALKKPHIVLIVADDLGWNDVGFHGSDQVVTPNIDALARDGIILNKYYVSPICTPSRASLITGKYSIKLGLQHHAIDCSEPWGLPVKEKTLPQYMKDLGYVTYGIGKWHLGFYTWNRTPHRRGFDSFFGFWSGNKEYFSHFAEDMHGYRAFDLHDNERPAFEYYGNYSTDLFTSKAREVIESHDKSKPLFLYLGYQAVHDPLEAPAEYIKKFDCISDYKRKIFAGMLYALDVGVGEVFESLEKSGILDETIVIFTTDNGGAVTLTNNASTGSNWPLRGGKLTLWEGGVRGSALIWSTELRKKRKIDENFFHITDWLPTLYAAAGGDVKKLKGIDGINQWPMLNERGPSMRKEILHNVDCTWKVASIRKGPYKLLTGSWNAKLDHWSDQEGKPELPGSKKYKRTCSYGDDIYREAKSMKVLVQKFGEVAMENRNPIVRVNCGPRPSNYAGNCFPNKTICLFDVENDPCEYYSIADSFREVKNELMNLLKEHMKSAIPPLNKPFDPTSDPKKYNWVWTPWLPD